MNTRIKSFLTAIQKDYKAGEHGYLCLYGTDLDNAFYEGDMDMVKEGICPATLVYRGKEEVNLSTLLGSLEKWDHPIIQAMVDCQGHEPDEMGISFSITYGNNPSLTLSLEEEGVTLTLSPEALLKVLKEYPL